MIDWLLPQDRVLINRLDSLCTLVLSGQWPTGRRYASDAQLNPGSDDLGAGDELSFARLMRKGNSTPGGEGADGEESEFTVKLLKVK
jgi:chromodomain helicase DNA binding protein 8